MFTFVSVFSAVNSCPASPTSALVYSKKAIWNSVFTS